MTENRNTEISCTELKENYDNLTSITSIESSHIHGCESCALWVNEIDKLNQFATEAPQFEVSEGLTQKILHDVKEIDQKEKQKLTTLASCLVVAAFVWIVLITDSIETIWGLASWVIGLTTLLGLKYLVQEPSNNLKSQHITGS